MTGWNMPPGCNVRDIPGNRPEDQKAEALADQIYRILEEVGYSIDDEKADHVVQAVSDIVGAAWADGYREGKSDETLANELG